jgi:hypothetical protein
MKSISPTLGQHVQVIEWANDEPLAPLDGWVVYINEWAFTLAASPDDPGGNADPDTFLRRSFWFEDTDIHPYGDTK